jgi:hypothetical protein
MSFQVGWLYEDPELICEALKSRTCEDLESWICEALKSRTCEDLKSWIYEALKSRICEDTESGIYEIRESMKFGNLQGPNSEVMAHEDFHE